MVKLREEGRVLAQNRFQFKFPVRNNKNTHLMPNAIFYFLARAQFTASTGRNWAPVLGTPDLRTDQAKLNGPTFD